MRRAKIVETDNHGGDYPNERFLNIPPVTDEQARIIADAINDALCPSDASDRFWKVVAADYELAPGFEP